MIFNTGSNNSFIILIFSVGFQLSNKMLCENKILQKTYHNNVRNMLEWIQILTDWKPCGLLWFSSLDPLSCPWHVKPLMREQRNRTQHQTNFLLREQVLALVLSRIKSPGFRLSLCKLRSCISFSICLEGRGKLESKNKLHGTTYWLIRTDKTQL